MFKKDFLFMFSITANSIMSARLCVGVAALTEALHCVWLCAAAICAATKHMRNKIEKFKFPKQILQIFDKGCLQRIGIGVCGGI
jgi:hypothetical protein